MFAWSADTTGSTMTKKHNKDGTVKFQIKSDCTQGLASDGDASTGAKSSAEKPDAATGAKSSAERLAGLALVISTAMLASI